MQYSELHVRLEARDDGAYDVVAAGEAGEALGVLELPFSDLELENFVLRVGRTRRGTRRLESPEMQRAREFGGRLFDALFSSKVRDLYRDCSASARADGKGLRLKLSLGRAPELTDVPWEYLYDSPAFLSISQFTPVVRYLELPRARSPLAVELPLRVLAMISAPIGAVALDVDDERRKVERAVQSLIERELVEITWLEQATLRALQRELRRGPYHVFHFIGHGAYDPGLGESVLLLEDEDGRGRPVSGAQLGTILADHTSLRLAVLNACEGARTSRDDPFSGVAAALVQHELPAVIAMQFEITDRAAIIFAEELYAALVDGLAVDAALAETRKAIYGDGNDIEWGTPVLFMRVRDGLLFEVPEPPPDAPRVRERDEEAQLAVERAEREEAERLAAEKAEREEAERLAAEQGEAERLSRERAEREAAEKAEREEAERLAAEQGEAERLSRERAEREAAEKAEREEAEQFALEQAEREQAEREQAEREQAEREDAERLAQEQAEAQRLAQEKAEAERLAHEQADPNETERAAQEQAAVQRPRMTRGARLLNLLPRRTWVRALAILAIVLVVVGVVGGVLAVTGVIGSGDGRTIVSSNYVTFTPTKDSRTSGEGYIDAYAVDETGTLEVVDLYGDFTFSGDRADVLEVLLFDNIGDLKTFTGLPPGVRRVEGGIKPTYTGTAQRGNFTVYARLPPNFQDFSFLGLARKPANGQLRHLAAYAPTSKFTLSS